MAGFQVADEDQAPGLGQGNLSEQPAMAEPFQSAQQQGGGMEQNLGLFQEAIQRAAEQAKEAGKPPIKMKVDLATGTIEGGGVPFEMLQGLLESQNQLQNIRGAFNAEAMRLQQRENQIRSNPILNILANVSAGLAQAPNMPGVVQGLGKANAALNPTPDALAQRRLGLLQAQAQLGEQSLGHQNALMTQLETIRQHGISNRQRDDALKLQAKGQEISEGKQGEVEQKNFEAPFLKGASDDKVPRLPNHDTFVKLATAKGIDAGDAEDSYGRIKEAFDRTVAGIAESDKRQRQNKVDTTEAVARAMTPLLAQRASAMNAPLAERAKTLGQIKNDTALNLKEELLNRGISEREAEAQVKGKGAGQLSAALLKEKGLVTPQEHKVLNESFATDQLLDRTERMLADPVFKNVSGPLFSVDPKTKSISVNMQAILPSSIKGVERTQYESQLAHELPRILNVINPNGATSLLRSPEGWKQVQALGASKNQRPDQIAAILDVIRGANNDRRAPIVASKTGVTWTDPENALLLGLGNPKNADYFLRGKDWKGAMSSGPVIRGQAPSTATPAPNASKVITKDDIDKLLGRK